MRLRAPPAQGRESLVTIDLRPVPEGTELTPTHARFYVSLLPDLVEFTLAGRRYLGRDGGEAARLPP